MYYTKLYMNKKFDFTTEEQNIIEKVVKENKICIAHDDNIAKADMLIEIGKRISDLENNNEKIIYVLPNSKKVDMYNERYQDKKEKYNMIFDDYNFQYKYSNINTNEYNDISTIIIDGVNNVVNYNNGYISIQTIYNFYTKVKEIKPKLRIYLVYNYFMVDTLVDLYAVSLILNRKWMKINSLFEAEEWGKFFWKVDKNDTEEKKRNKYQIFQNVNVLTNMVNKFVIYDEFELLKKMNFDMELNVIKTDNFMDNLDNIMLNVKKNINNGLQAIKIVKEETKWMNGRLRLIYDSEMLKKILVEKIEEIGLSDDEVKIYLKGDNSIDKISDEKHNNLISDNTKLVIYNSEDVEKELFCDENIEFVNLYYYGNDILNKIECFLNLIKMLCKNNKILDKKLYLYVDESKHKKNIDELRQKYNFIKNIKVNNSEILVDVVEKYIDVIDKVYNIDFRADYQNFIEQQESNS